jgi:hypothetical protein
MKKCLLLALTVLGFTSFSYAAPETLLTCNGDGKIDWIGASLILGTQWGDVAYLADNYDSAQNPNPKPNGRYGMKCRTEGTSIECVGQWATARKPAKVVFTTDEAGNVSATFARSPFRGSEVVTFPCIVKEQSPE